MVGARSFEQSLLAKFVVMFVIEVVGHRHVLLIEHSAVDLTSLKEHGFTNSANQPLLTPFFHPILLSVVVVVVWQAVLVYADLAEAVHHRVHVVPTAFQPSGLLG